MEHLYHTTRASITTLGRPRLRAHSGRAGQNDFKSPRWGKIRLTQCLLDRTELRPSNSQQLWFPAQDLDNTKTVNTLAWNTNRFTSPTPWMRSCWQLMASEDEGVSFLGGHGHWEVDHITVDGPTPRRIWAAQIRISRLFAGEGNATLGVVGLGMDLGGVRRKNVRWYDQSALYALWNSKQMNKNKNLKVFLKEWVMTSNLRRFKNQKQKSKNQFKSVPSMKKKKLRQH